MSPDSTSYDQKVTVTMVDAQTGICVSSGLGCSHALDTFHYEHSDRFWGVERESGALAFPGDVDHVQDALVPASMSAGVVSM